MSLLLPKVVSTVDFSSYGCNSARQAMLDLHSKEKTVDYTDNLMVYKISSFLSVIFFCFRNSVCKNLV